MRIPMPRNKRQLLLVTLLFILLYGGWRKLKIKEWTSCLSQALPEDEEMPAWSQLPRLNDDHGAESELRQVLVLLAPRPSATVAIMSIVFAMSLPENAHHRNEIRNSWKKWGESEKTQVIFFVGTRATWVDSSATIVIPHSLMEESQEYGDILLVEHVEDYNALPLKVLKAMKYFLMQDYGNPDTSRPFFVKTDDDVFVNLRNLGSYLRAQVPHSDFIAGNKFTLPSPSRDPKSKFYIPYAIYPYCYWPSYVGGSLYVMSPSAVKCVLERSMNEGRVLPIEDLYLTGILGNWKCHYSIYSMRGIYDTPGRTKMALQDEQALKDAISFTFLPREKIDGLSFDMASLFHLLDGPSL